MTAARGMLRLFALLLTAFPFVRSSFEPYQLNGGLVAAVAGKDYCVIASDTRLTDGGYEIYTRRHLTSRLWSVLDEDTVCEPDGSLSISTKETTLSKPPVWIASSGCAADCEALKRNVRMEARASQYWNTEMGVQSVSTLLSQVLYRRRGFPYYSFCVVAGLSSLEGEGAVFVYDAIGSFEQVAVATAGTGRELLQPILDRLFSSPETKEKVKLPETTSGGTMPKVVETQVSCSADEAVSRLIRGYKSVAERDIGVGDSVVLCVTQRNKEDGTTTCRVLSVPLKTH